MKNSLWRDRNFVLFWLARTVSLAGSAITTVALPILVFQLTGSAAQTALLAAMRVLPYLAFGLVAGAVSDRVNRRRLMVGCDLVSAALLASLPLAGLFGALTLPHIYAVALLSASAFVWFDAANFGALPALVGRERLVEANSIIWSSSILVEIGALALGGLLVANLGAGPTLVLDGLSYLASALLLLAIPKAFDRTTGDGRPETEDRKPEPELRTTRWHSLFVSLGSDIREGLQFIWRQPLVRAMTLLGAGNSFASGAVQGLVVVYAVQALGLQAEDERVGLFFTAGALGALAASLLLPRLNRWVPVGLVTLVGLAANAGLMAVLALAPEVWSGMLLYGIWHIAFTLIIVNGINLRQLVTPDHLQGRVNATARMIAWGGAPFGALVGGLLADQVGVRPTFLFMAALMLLIALLGWLTPLRERTSLSDGVVVQP